MRIEKRAKFNRDKEFYSARWKEEKVSDLSGCEIYGGQTPGGGGIEHKELVGSAA